MELHSHDARKCANPGCTKPGTDEHMIVLTGARVNRYCDEDCEREHLLLLKRRAPNMVPES